MVKLPLKHRHDRAILQLALPAVGSLAIDPLVSLVDTAFVGRLGAAPLGALGVNAAVFAFFFLIFNFLAYGTTPRIGNALGRGEKEEAGKTIVQALFLALGLGSLATLMLLIFADPILGAMGASGELEEPARQYLQIRAFAGPAVLVMIAANGAFRGYQDTTTPLKVAFLFNGINLVLDPLFIFGFGWGIAGAAAATVIAQWTGAALFLGLLFGTHKKAFGISFQRPSFQEMVPLLSVGGFLFLRTVTLIFTMTFATATAARLGVIEVAAHQIAYQLWGFFALLVDALAIAGQSLVANHLGREDRREAREVGNRLLQWGLLLGLIIGALFLIVSPFLGRIFTPEEEILLLLGPIFLFVAVLQPLNGLVFVWDGLFMGVQVFRYLAVAMIMSALIAIPILVMTPRMGWGLEGVWWAITAMMVLRALTLAIPWFRGSLLFLTEDRAGPRPE